MWTKKAAASAIFVIAIAGGTPAIANADPSTPAPAPPAGQADADSPGTSNAAVTPINPDTPANAAIPTPITAVDPTAPKTTIDADGTYAVGTDIVPGVYSTAGPVADGACFWKRIGNPNGTTIDNALTKKPQTVQIDPTDASFKTNGCQPWQLTDGAAPPPSSGLAPALANLQLQAWMAQLNARAAASGQAPSP